MGSFDGVPGEGHDIMMSQATFPMISSLPSCDIEAGGIKLKAFSWEEIALMSRWFSFSLIVGYVSVPWRIRFLNLSTHSIINVRGCSSLEGWCLGKSINLIKSAHKWVIFWREVVIYKNKHSPAPTFRYSSRLSLETSCWVSYIAETLRVWKNCKSIREIYHYKELPWKIGSTPCQKQPLETSLQNNPPKTKMTMESSTHEWRCISYLKTGDFPASHVVFRADIKFYHLY